MKRAILLLTAVLLPLSAQAAWDGVIDWARRTRLATPVNGVVANVPVRAGERVKQGTLLLQLEQKALKARVEQMKAALQHATLLREEADRELQRSQELYDRTLLADHDLNIAKLAYAEADAAYQRSRADHLAAEETLRESELHAPFDALVIDRLVQPGEAVANQLQVAPMLVVASATERVARFTVTGDEMRKFSPGTKLEVECAGKRYPGSVESLNLASGGKYGSSSSGTFTVEVLFASDKSLLPGTAAKIDLP